MSRNSHSILNYNRLLYTDIILILLEIINIICIDWLVIRKLKIIMPVIIPTKDYGHKIFALFQISHALNTLNILNSN